ncbi:hypothetical protein L3i20_v229470 [Paenibacillus sp. L3-i20]|nr:hypothetical protein L3i20_v229470 [Paenibacillus sp. L3-i20]
MFVKNQYLVSSKSKTQKSWDLCIITPNREKLKTSASEDVVDNRGEGLRFPISSSSGFSSPMIEALERGPRLFCLKPLIYKGFLESLEKLI